MSLSQAEFYTAVQIYPCWWLQVVELLADLLQNDHQYPNAAAHSADSAETASHSGPSQTGSWLLHILATAVYMNTFLFFLNIF